MFVFVNECSYCALVKHMLDKSILTKLVGFNGVHVLLCWKWSLKNLSSGILHYVLALEMKHLTALSYQKDFQSWASSRYVYVNPQ